MAHTPLLLTVGKHTTSAEIACFLQQAGEKVCRPDAGLRARQGVGANGKHDGTVVLYVRNNSEPKTLGDRVTLFVEDVKAFFNAKEEYRLAAVTLLERARFSGSHEMEFQDGTKLCPILARVSEGKGERLTIQSTHRLSPRALACSQLSFLLHFVKTSPSSRVFQTQDKRIAKRHGKSLNKD